MTRFTLSIHILLLCQAALAQPSNDDCANPIDFGDISVPQSLMVDFSMATESLDASCEFSSNLNYDLWYSFTMPFLGNVIIDGVGGIDRTTLYTQCGGSEITCSAGDQFIPSLSANVTYLVRFSSTLSNRIIHPEIQAYPLAANDECTTAIVLGDVANEQAIQVDTRNATESIMLSCDFAGTENVDLWYEFTMPFDGRIIFDGVYATARVAIVSGCSDSPTEIGCNQGGGFIDDLESGRTYYFRYASPTAFASLDAFTVQAFELAANDECSTPEMLPDISTSVTIVPDTRHASQSLQASCETNPENWDLWYGFTMPFTGSVQVTGVFGVNRIAVYDGCGGTEITCFQNSGFIYNLQSGQNYLLRFATIPLQAGPDQISISAFEPPAHDECAAAIDLGDISVQKSLITDTRTATESMDVSCEDASLQNLDLWYKFTMPFTGKVHVTGVFGVNKLTLFDGCGGNEIACEQGFSFFYGLIGGVEYILRYAASSVHAGQDQIFIEAFPPPPNDECSNPIAIANPDQERSIILDTREATETLNASCEDPLENHLDLWYDFTMPYDGNLQITGVFGFNRLVLYDQCAQNELECGIGNSLFLNLIGNQSYLIRYAAIESQAGADEIFVRSYPTALNDQCVDAIDLGDISTPHFIEANTAGASEEIDASCETSSNLNLDLWYSFTMPIDGQIEISGASAAFRFSLFDGCGGGELSCFNGDGMAGNLSAGEIYLLRYSSSQLSAGPSQFNITAMASLPVQLISFEASRNSEGPVDLSWHIGSETNNAGFTIERSLDALHWSDIGWIPGRGTTTQAHFYNFRDRDVPDDRVFYRLAQLDYDGSLEYSKIIAAPSRLKNLSRMYPNPASDFLFIKGEIGQHLQVRAITGERLRVLEIGDGRISIGDLPGGVYLIEYVAQGQRHQEKLLVL